MEESSMKIAKMTNYVFALAMALGLSVSQAQTTASASQQAKSPGQLLFEEKCRTVAGEMVYRKIEDVDGLLLTKVRPSAGDAGWADVMWPDEVRIAMLGAGSMEPNGAGRRIAA
jgi:hypothetical protein